MKISAMQEVLTRAPFNAAQQTLTPQEAAIRAPMVVQDMAECGIEITLQSFSIGHDIWVPYYEIPRTDFQQEQGDEDNPVSDALTGAGSGLNWGDPIRLSKACKIGRSLIPHLWPRKFKDKLISDHLATIQEMLWLSRFRNPRNIEAEPRPFPGYKKGPDWRFSCDGQTINLEVKYRPGDWMRHVDGSEYSPARPGLFYDAADKFPIQLPGELNLVALSVMAPIEESLISATNVFLQNTRTVDAVLIWTDGPQGGPATTVLPRPSSFVRAFYNEGDGEDRCHIGLIRHIQRNSKERRNITPAEAPAAIAEIARQYLNE